MDSPSKRSLVLSFAGLCVLNLIASIDATALSVSLPTIATALQATSVQAYWSGTSFLLSSAVCQPVFAAFSNAFGRKSMVLVALALFIIGTILCATAQSIAQLLAGRTVQGAGGGGMLTMTYVVMADLLSLRERAKGMSVVSLVWLVGTVAGPILGGGFTTSVSWRWIFWICLPFAGISLVLIAFCLKTPHRHLNPAQALKKVDWVGAVLFIGSLTGFLLGLSWGGSVFAWPSWQTLVPLIVGAVGLATWVVWERLIPESPLLPLSILANRTAVAAFIGTLALGIIQFGLLYYLPLYYQVMKGYSPLMSGVALLPQCLLSGPTTAITGALISISGQYRLIIWIGWALFALGCGLLVLLDANTTIPQWIFINAVSGLGMGALFASLSIATQAATAEKHMAIASGLTPFFRAIGQAFGIVIGNTVFQNVFQDRLLNAVSEVIRRNAAAYARDAASMALVTRTMAPDSIERVELLEAFNSGLHAVWWTLTAFALAAGLLSLVIRQISLDRKEADTPDVPAADEEKGASTTAVEDKPAPLPDAVLSKFGSEKKVYGAEELFNETGSLQTSISDGLQHEVGEAPTHDLRRGIGDDMML